ncbi:MAG TPA: leucyl/phenylalanyl-tRNA--protein transferase [Myxococcota bacterium]|nr:leucyl/phenylalanyl-tRNA--protein transferase [Myxococcota bacterium]
MDPERPDAELLVRAYARGIFPMADPRTGKIAYYSPDPRAIFPLDAFHVPKSVARVARSGVFELRSDTAFAEVIARCAEARPGRRETWLSPRLVRAYLDLHRRGFAHSVEAWRDGRLVGGLYGVHIGAAFFGESMFSRPEQGGRDSSKVCLAALVEWLRKGGFRLLDTQFSTPHLARFGCVEVARDEYLELLENALVGRGRWPKT